MASQIWAKFYIEILDDPKYLEVASGVCESILADLPREKTSAGTCISYVPFKQMCLHNSNMLAAAMLARTAGHTGDDKALEVAKEAMASGRTIREVVLEKGYLSEEEVDKLLDARKMTEGGILK